MNLAKLQHTRPFMPPFAGTPAELEALVQWLLWGHDGRPARWAIAADPERMTRIARWLEEAGSEPHRPKRGEPR